MPDTPTTFTHPDLPDITFEVTRGSGGQPGLPSNWINITGRDNSGNIISQAGFAGP